MFLYCLSDIRMPVDCKITSIIEMAKPITELVEKYKNSKGYKNDLDYAYFICNSVINVILNEVMKNEYIKEKYYQL